MEQLSALETGLGSAAETRIEASKTTCEINDKNQIEEQFISSHAFHRTTSGRLREITAGMQFELGNIEFFDSTTQEQQYRLHPVTIHNKTDNSKSKAHG
jgi:hypothetical protein